MQTDLEIYRDRRRYQDVIYKKLFWLADLACEENWHPDVEPIRQNIKRAISEYEKKIS